MAGCGASRTAAGRGTPAGGPDDARARLRHRPVLASRRSTWRLLHRDRRLAALPTAHHSRSSGARARRAGAWLMQSRARAVCMQRACTCLHVVCTARAQRVGGLLRSRMHVAATAGSRPRSRSGRAVLKRAHAQRRQPHRRGARPRLARASHRTRRSPQEATPAHRASPATPRLQRPVSPPPREHPLDSLVTPASACRCLPAAWPP